MIADAEQKALRQFLDTWPSDQQGLKDAYVEFVEMVKGLPDTECRFVSRPGISHSFRANAEEGRTERKRPVFLLMDVVSEKDGPYWLSLCFYGDEIQDPDEEGDAIPQGLFGETGYCFDMDEYDEAKQEYLKTRIEEAHKAATGASKE